MGLRGRHPRTEMLHGVLEGVKFEGKSEVLSYAAEDKIKFYETPTNTSCLNRIECNLTAIKRFTLDDTECCSHEEQQAAINHYLSWRNGTRKNSLEHWKSYRRAQKEVA